MISIMGFDAVAASRLPATAKKRLSKSIRFDPILSVSTPEGIESSAWQRGGMAARMPSYCMFRPNSSLIMGKEAV